MNSANVAQHTWMTPGQFCPNSPGAGWCERARRFHYVVSSGSAALHQGPGIALGAFGYLGKNRAYSDTCLHIFWGISGALSRAALKTRKGYAMQYRQLGKTGYRVSCVSFGAWAIGGAWGSVDDQESLAALHRCVDLGVNFIDTADVYGDGRSERLIAELRRARSEPIVVATKAGRRLNPHTAAGYNRHNLTQFVEQSLRNLGTDALDLLQLHCPPTDVYYQPLVFDVLDNLVKEGKVRHYGVSVERVEEALKAIEYPNVTTVQIIYNVFRQRPAELFFREAQVRNVGILARLPLSSGLLAGKMSRQTQFSADDHRAFNRQGAAFDRGETFSGIDFDQSLRAVELLRPLVPAGMTMAQFALAWILTQPAVSCVIPGAKRPSQVVENCGAADLPGLSPATLKAVEAIYLEHICPLVHHYW
jgi:aryl-alcohol dehydrogenase-like predicted oxidoreductase